VRKTESELAPEAPVTGDALKRVREARGLTLKELEARTKIGHWHLDNIEREKFAALPAQVYLRGFLMSLARELKLDPVRVSKSYLEQMKAKQAPKPE
jgi:cytoskeletal protein RodZ